MKCVPCASVSLTHLGEGEQRCCSVSHSGAQGMGYWDKGVSQLKPCHAFGKLGPHPRAGKGTSPQGLRMLPTRCPPTSSQSAPLSGFPQAPWSSGERGTSASPGLRGKPAGRCFYCSFGQTGIRELGYAGESARPYPSGLVPGQEGAAEPWPQAGAGQGGGRHRLPAAGATWRRAPPLPSSGEPCGGQGWVEPGPRGGVLSRSR